MSRVISSHTSIGSLTLAAFSEEASTSSAAASPTNLQQMLRLELRIGGSDNVLRGGGG